MLSWSLEREETFVDVVIHICHRRSQATCEQQQLKEQQQQQRAQSGNAT